MSGISPNLEKNIYKCFVVMPMNQWSKSLITGYKSGLFHFNFKVLCPDCPSQNDVLHTITLTLYSNIPYSEVFDKRRKLFVIALISGVTQYLKKK